MQRERISGSGTTNKYTNNGRDLGNGGKKRSSGLKKAGIALVAAFAAVAVAYAVLSNTDVFEIESIEVEGSTRLSDSYLTSAVSVPKGSNLLNVDASGIVESVSSTPWVDSVKVARSFPHTLVLRIEENDPAAVVEVEVTSSDGTESEYWLIDGDGYWMGEVSEEGVDEARQIVIDSTNEEGSETGGEFADYEYEDDDGDSEDGTDETSEDESSDETSEDGTEEESSDGSDSEEEDSGDESEDAVEEGSDDGDDDASDEASEDGDSDDGSDSDSSGSGDDASDSASVSSDVYYTVEELSQIPIITEISSDVSPAVGQQESDEGIVNALEIIEDSEGDFGDQIATITSANGSSTSVILTNGIEVSFGEAEDMEEKIAVVEELLEQYPDQISYINVRVASMPSWRSVDQ